MTKSIYSKKKNDIVTREESTRNKLSFSFDMLTNNRSHNHCCLENSTLCNSKTTKYLFEFLRKISSMSWQEFYGLNKHVGGPDFLRKDQFLHDVFDKCNNPTGDVKYGVSYFGHDNKHRLIFKLDTHTKDLLHIIGFDFDFTLYKH